MLFLQFQYGHPDVVCSPLINAKKDGKNLVVRPFTSEIITEL
jgi:hypothetical protein